MFDYNGFEVFWDGKESLRVRDNEFTVAVDPKTGSASDFEAAIVLVTSEDESDFDKRKIQEVCGRGTCVVLPEALEDLSIPCPDVEFLRPGEALDIYSVEIKAVETSEGLAYRFNMRGTSFFVSGDSCDIREAIRLENTVNLAFFSASEGIDMDEVVRKAVRIKPDTVFPYLYSPEQSLDGFKAELEDRNINCQLDS